MGQASQFGEGKPTADMGVPSSLNSSQEEVSVTREPVSSKCGRFYPRTSLLFGGFARFYFKSELEFFAFVGWGRIMSFSAC